MRDELGLSGEQRDLFSGLYSFSKGIAQFYFGQHSDQNTRATPIRWGLIGGGLSLIIASWARVGGVTYPGLLHFGAVTLGLSTGAVYPVLAFHLSGVSMILMGAYFGFAYEENVPASSE